ncbi:unnamed protein product [Brassica napus]|uniref:(rape) hypothetical protein n=1 Tax=Brassica napus TaxID=3708 RepID=A0A816J688_BRANA|nr:unnamed protein product [Brassica napus]
MGSFVATKTEDRYCSLQRSTTWWAHCHTWTSRVVSRLMLSLSPLSFHADVSKTCIELKKHLITASYVDGETSM